MKDLKKQYQEELGKVSEKVNKLKYLLNEHKQLEIDCCTLSALIELNNNSQIHGILVGIFFC